MKIYIAGKVTGNSNYENDFGEAQRYLTSKGHLCMNPAVLPEGFNWDDYIPICFKMIDACDSIYMLKNWMSSKGAQAELAYAKAGKKKIIFQKEID